MPLHASSALFSSVQFGNGRGEARCDEAAGLCDIQGMADAAREQMRMSLEEWAALDEDVAGELVDGVLVEEEDVGALHETIAGHLVFLLRSWLGTRGRVLTSDAKFAVSEARGRKPDVTVYFEKTRLPARRAVSVPPDIAIEIVSPTPRDRRRDRFEKLVEYARFGIRQYWLIDPEPRTFEVLVRQADATYAIALVASEGQLAVPGCEGLVVDLDAMWAEIADFDDAE